MMEDIETLWIQFLGGDKSAIHPLFDILLDANCESFKTKRDIQDYKDFIQLSEEDIMFPPLFMYVVYSNTVCISSTPGAVSGEGCGTPYFGGWYHGDGCGGIGYSHIDDQGSPTSLSFTNELEHGSGWSLSSEIL